MNFSFATNTGYWFPARTPRPIVDRLNREINTIINEPEIKSWIEGTGAVVIGSTPEQFRDFIAKDHAFLSEGARLINYQPQ